jgi:ribosomal protein L11 methyltransferase
MQRATADTTPIEAVTGVYDLVVANIEAQVLIVMASPLAARVKPGGALVLSGILRERADEVRRAFEALGRFARAETHHEGEWSALVFRE